MRLRPLSCLDWGFESHRRNGRLSLVKVVCCQVEVSTSDPSAGGVLPRVLCLNVITKLREKGDDDRNIDRSATERKTKKYN